MLPASSKRGSIGKGGTDEPEGQRKEGKRDDIFPCFQTITSPDAFFTQVSHRALFAPHECRISDVFVQRLRLATAFYEKRNSEIPEICGEYTKVLADAPYLTSGCKKIYLNEVRLFQNAMTLSDPEAASGAKTAVSI